MRKRVCRFEGYPDAMRLVLLFSAVGFVFLGGCSIHAGGNEDPARVADGLRTRVAQLEADIAQRDAAIAELNKKLEKAQALVLTPEQSAALPTITKVVIDARSGLARNGGSFEVLLVTLDGRDRFMQVAGSLDISVRDAGADEDAAPVYVKQLGPLAVRDAYRSGFMGTHYVIDIPLTDAIKAAYENSGLQVEVELAQVTNDQVLTTSKLLKKK
jgi:hypothetical protein